MSNENSSNNEPLIPIAPGPSAELMEIPELSEKQLADLAKLRKALSVQRTANPRAERALLFGFVAQADIPGQMDVVRWLRDDCRYRVVTILHDRDIHDEDGEAVRNGEKVPYHAGDKKADHWHGILKVGAKITAKSLAKRFGGYLHFELLHDAAEYAYYMLHKTYNARNKARYSVSELRDDTALWYELADSEREDWTASIVELVASYRDELGQISVDAMLAMGDTLALKALMKHSYFYATFVNKNLNKGG